MQFVRYRPMGLVVVLIWVLHVLPPAAQATTSAPSGSRLAPAEASLFWPPGHCNSDAVALGMPASEPDPPAITKIAVPWIFWNWFALPSPAGDPRWRMIYAPGGFTTVVYTEDKAAYPQDALVDVFGSDLNAAGNADINNNDIPDYAERILACYDRAWERLEPHFTPDPVTQFMMRTV